MQHPFDHANRPPDIPPDMPDDETVQAVGQFLHRWQAPTADPAVKAAAKAQLMARLAQARAIPQVTARPPLRMSLRWAWLILRSQTRIIHALSWAGTALLLGLGMVVTLISYQTPNGTTLPLILVAPIVAALGVAFLYGEDVDPPLELQMTMPVSPRVILLARLALLFGFNLALALGCSLVLAATQSSVSLLPLVLAWLAPMTFLSALAFTLSVMLFNTTISSVVSIVLWFVLVWRHFGEVAATPYVLVLPDLLATEQYPLLFAGAAALVALALWLSERENRLTATRE